MAPIERTSLLVAKAGALIVYLVALELIALPVFALFFIEEGFWEALPRLAVVTLLADVGLAVVGAMLASIAVHTRARDLLLPILLLPLTVPVVIAAPRPPPSRSCRSRWTRRAWGNGWLFWPSMIWSSAFWPTRYSTS